VPQKDLARRAVVTGLGAVTPIGNDHPTFWKNLITGVSGVGPITRFDASGFDVRIAAEVRTSTRRSPWTARWRGA
jgi:3-oxoacyl-[acyl-carrier-protein] synthase II